MTRPPRPKYPWDTRNDHEIRKPGHAHTHDRDGDMDDEAMSNPDESQSDNDIALDSADDAPASEEEDPELSCCFDSQAQSNVETSVAAYPDATNSGWISAALELWDESKANLQQELLSSGKPLVLYVNCMLDSSRSGYQGTLPIINIEDDQVIEMITLTRKQTCSRGGGGVRDVRSEE
ncbi:hypothetical protein R1sor_020308 [Riccia sorocarpa]|uniref:Uncharacterized protein n=1 Tax=Riccia sorocarpa TaxID=122646 RepID=A0ABD3IG46_9MARC